MKRLILSSLLMLATVALAIPAVAQSLPTTSPGPHSARVNGALGEPLRELFAVRFIGIDGRNIQPRDVMWLEPGTYTLTVAIDAFHVQSPPLGGARAQRREPRGYNQIELELEAGKSYEIRARYDRDNRDARYSIVLHRVDELH